MVGRRTDRRAAGRPCHLHRRAGVLSGHPPFELSRLGHRLRFESPHGHSRGGIGSLTFGSDDRPAEMELVRTAIPRRAYTQGHVDYVAEAVLEVFDRRDTLKPLRICEAPPQLRHFTARLAEMDL